MHHRYRLLYKLVLRTTSILLFLHCSALLAEASETDQAVAELFGYEGSVETSGGRTREEIPETLPVYDDRPLYETDERRQAREGNPTTGNGTNERAPGIPRTEPFIIDDGGTGVITSEIPESISLPDILRGNGGYGKIPGSISLPDVLGGNGGYGEIPGTVSIPDVLGTPDILGGNNGGFETGSGSIPGTVWDIIQAESGFSIGGTEIEDIWNVISTGYELPDYGSIFGNGDILSGGYGGGVILNATSGGGTPSSIPNGRTVPTIPGSTPPATVSGGGTPPIAATNGGGSARTVNPFKWLMRWSRDKFLNPLLEAFGRSGSRTRVPFENKAVGRLSRNSVVKKRDQANMLSQELARMMAEPKLGKEGEEWMALESAESLKIIELGAQQANTSMELAVQTQQLTSTQDVAKAVARIGGHNAQVIATGMQLQAQSRASLLELQQMMAADLEVAANISEGIDESNRRERLERSNTFYNNAGETLYLRGVF